MKQKILFVVAAVALLLVFAVGAWVYKSREIDEPAQLGDPIYTQLVRMHSPTLGKPDAKVQLVEFFDPACGPCASFYPMVKKIVDSHRGLIDVDRSPEGGAMFTVRLPMVLEG